MDYNDQHSSSYSTQDLTELIRVIAQKPHERVQDDESKFRYVIYARKSTESVERQVRSLSDQILECREYAERQRPELKIAKIFTESESAKEPDIRPHFNEMIDGFKKGKYEGILAWHPDRLARNMKDAGLVIDLLDKGIIKNIHFVSFTFQNNTTGKMMLGITFVLSKQYSDQLSDNIRRGISRSMQEGKYVHHFKHGYFKDRNQFLGPDGDNFVLFKQAWEMRIEGKTYDEISEFLNASNYMVSKVIGGDEHQRYKITKQILTNIFRDPVYAGVQWYGDEVVDLTNVYDFIPMVSVDNFLTLNKLSTIDKVFKQKTKGRTKDEGVKANLLRGKVLCADCGRPKSTGITTKTLANGEKKNIFYYRCDTDRCKFFGTSTRARVIFDFSIQFLKERMKASHEIYTHYVTEMKRLNKEREKDLDSLRRSLISERTAVQDKLEKTKRMYISEESGEIKRLFSGDLTSYESQIVQLNKQIEEVKRSLSVSSESIVSYRKFIELFEKIPINIEKSDTLEMLNFYLGKIFSNYVVEPRKVVSWSLERPFDTFLGEVKSDEVELPGLEPGTNEV